MSKLMFFLAGVSDVTDMLCEKPAIDGTPETFLMKYLISGAARENPGET